MTDKDRQRVVLALSERAANQENRARSRSYAGPSNAEYRKHLRQDAKACRRLALDIQAGYVALMDIPREVLMSGYDERATDIQAAADANHARQPVCSWCGCPGGPYEYRGVRFDGLTACEGDRLCAMCRDRYLRATPLLIEDRLQADVPGAIYDLNPGTAAWSERNIPGCRGEPPVQVIAVAYRYLQLGRGKCAKYSPLCSSRTLVRCSTRSPGTMCARPRLRPKSGSLWWDRSWGLSCPGTSASGCTGCGAMTRLAAGSGRRKVMRSGLAG